MTRVSTTFRPLFDQVVGHELLCAGSDEAVWAWDMRRWERVGNFSGHSSWVNAMVIHTARRIMVTVRCGCVGAWVRGCVWWVHVRV